MMATWIRADGRVDQVLLPEGDHDRMLFIQKCVDGYYTPINMNDGKVMLVNEEGMLRGLPPNSKASAILSGSDFKEMFPDAINEHTLATKTGMAILGDVLVADAKELR